MYPDKIIFYNHSQKKTMYEKILHIDISTIITLAKVIVFTNNVTEM